MEGETVLYDGRIIPKEGFRVFIYGFNNETKLVESWDEYQEHISSGVWFSHKNSEELIQATESDAHKDKKRGRD